MCLARASYSFRVGKRTSLTQESVAHSSTLLLSPLFFSECNVVSSSEAPNPTFRACPVTQAHMLSELLRFQSQHRARDRYVVGPCLFKPTQQRTVYFRLVLESLTLHLSINLTAIEFFFQLFTIFQNGADCCLRHIVLRSDIHLFLVCLFHFFCCCLFLFVWLGGGGVLFLFQCLSTNRFFVLMTAHYISPFCEKGDYSKKKYHYSRTPACVGLENDITTTGDIDTSRL